MAKYSHCSNQKLSPFKRPHVFTYFSNFEVIFFLIFFYRTRQMMRLSQPLCTVCGKRTHLAGDRICIKTAAVELALNPVIRAMKKNAKSHTVENRLVEHRRMTQQRISVLELKKEAGVRRRPTFITCPLLMPEKTAYKSGDHGRNQIATVWEKAVGLSPRPPCSTKQRKTGGIVRKLSISSRIQKIRNAWPHQTTIWEGDGDRIE